MNSTPRTLSRSSPWFLPLPSLTTAVGNDPSGAQESWREKVGGVRTLADDYEYVMYDKVYKYDKGQGSKV